MASFLSIIIPSYNEEQRLPATLNLLQGWLAKQPFSVEILIVDDGSKDQTAKVAEGLIEEYAKVAQSQKLEAQYGGGVSSLKVISYHPNRGKGGAVVQGMLEAEGRWRLFMDADMSTPIAELDKLLPYRDNFEIIVGSRYLKSSKIIIKQPLKRRILSRGGYQLIKLQTGLKLKDTQCGFKLFSAAAAKMIFPKQKIKGWLFDVETMVIAKELGIKVKEVGVDWYDAKQSKLKAVQTASRSLQDLKIIKQNRKLGIYKEVC